MNHMALSILIYILFFPMDTKRERQTNLIVSSLLEYIEINIIKYIKIVR